MNEVSHRDIVNMADEAALKSKLFPVDELASIEGAVENGKTHCEMRAEAS